MNRMLSLFALSVLVSSAAAEVKVLTSNSTSGSVAPTSEATSQFVAGKYQVEFTPAANGDYYILSDPGDVVEWIRNTPGNLNVSVSTVSGRRVPVVEEITTAFTGFGRFRVERFEIGERLGPTSPTTQPLVRVHDINILQGLTASSINCGIEFRSAASNLGFIEFPQATLRSDIRNISGGILEIIVKAVDGSANAVHIVAKDTLRRLRVGLTDSDGNSLSDDDAINLNIGDPAIPAADRTMRVGDIYIARDFIGQMAIKGLEGGSGLQSVISTGRDMNAFVDIEDGIGGTGNRLSCTPAIRIGRTLTAGSRIRLPMPVSPLLPAMGRLITINASRIGNVNQNGMWLGKIGFGRQADGTSLVRELQKDVRGQYKDFSGEFGFGAAGVVPFGTYGPDSYVAFVEAGATQVSQRTVFREVDVDQSFTRSYKGVPEHLYARVRFYGQVVTEFDGDNQDNAIIEYRSRNAANTGCWTRLCLATVASEKVCRELIVSGGDAPPGVIPPPKPLICTPECYIAIGTTCNASLNQPTNCLTEESNDGTPGNPEAFGLGGDKWSTLNHVFLNNYEYRIRIPNGNLLTEGIVRNYNLLGTSIVPSTDLVSAETDDSVKFFVGCACLADLNGDGFQNTTDLTMFLGKFGQTAPTCLPDAPACGTTIPPPFVGDLNGDGVVNTLDLTMFLSRFSTPCFQPPNCPSNTAFYNPPPTPSQVRKSTTPDGVAHGDGAMTQTSVPSIAGPVIAALGYSSAEAYQAYVDTLSQEELKAHLILVLAVAQSIEGATP